MIARNFMLQIDPTKNGKNYMCYLSNQCLLNANGATSARGVDKGVGIEEQEFRQIGQVGCRLIQQSTHLR